VQGNFQAAVSYWSGRIDPDGNMYSFLHSGAPLNEGRYTNASLDALLDQARQTMSIDDRRAVYSNAWEHAAHDLPIT
jgi:peptide/nickel transport system substrate-binding protein